MMVGEWWISGDDVMQRSGEPSVDSEVCRLETCLIKEEKGVPNQMFWNTNSITALCLSGGNSFFLPTKS